MAHHHRRMRTYRAHMAHESQTLASAGLQRKWGIIGSYSAGSAEELESARGGEIGWLLQAEATSWRRPRNTRPGEHGRRSRFVLDHVAARPHAGPSEDYA